MDSKIKLFIEDKDGNEVEVKLNGELLDVFIDSEDK